MAQNSMALRIVSEAFKNGGRCSRALHDSVAVKKGLHNAEVVGMVADSMGRSRVKLTASDVERNGMTRVGPTPDILHQMPKMGLETTGATAAEPPIESKSGFVMTDPNSSMWNLCKGNKEAETTAKKITKKFIKMKDNIKQYYMDRLEENQVMFNEIEEPLRIGKIDKKERSPKYREIREVEFEPMEESQAAQRTRKSQRLSLFNQLQNKPEMETEGTIAQEETYPEPQVKGYKKFNKLEYKKSIDRGDVTERDFEVRANRMMAKGDERMYVDQERPMVPSMWKRPQVKADKEVKDSRGDGGFSDVTGTMTPAVHFKYQKVGLRSKGLLDSIRSGDLVQGFYKKRLSESRNFSTHMKDTNVGKLKNASGFDHFKPVPLILQREIVSNSGLRCVDNKLISAHSLSTCSKCNNNDDPCRPPCLPPKDMPCDPKDKLPKCPKLGDYEWPCCPKITLCGCDPPNPRINKPGCGMGELRPYMSLAKRPEYICPSFSECLRRPEMSESRKKKTECCITRKTCDNFVGPRKPFVSALERQEISLGQKYWTGQKQPCCQFHRSARFHPVILAKKPWNSQRQQSAGFHRTSILAAEEECDKPGKNQLPCQRTYNIPGMRKKEKPQGKGSCEKLCMPCCEPARDPPECLSIYQKGPCTKYKNPRPSFSECRKRFPFKHTMCECEVPAKPRCDHKKKQESTC